MENTRNVQHNATVLQSHKGKTAIGANTGTKAMEEKCFGRHILPKHSSVVLGFNGPIGVANYPLWYDPVIHVKKKAVFRVKQTLHCSIEMQHAAHNYT